MKWQGIEIQDLTEEQLLEAHKRALRICGELWAEVGRRKMTMRACENAGLPPPKKPAR